MPKIPKKDSLPEKDYLVILELILQFHDCRTRRELKTVLKGRLLPMLKAQDSAYFWIDPDITSIQALDLIGFPEKDREILQARLQRNPLTRNMSKMACPIIASGIDFSMENLHESAAIFFRDNPRFKWKDHPYMGKS